MVGGAQVIVCGDVTKGVENKAERAPFLLGENTRCVLVQPLFDVCLQKVMFNI